MNQLLEKMRRARESRVIVSGHSFTIRRPTDLEVVEFQAMDGGLNLRNAQRFIVGWDLKGVDLLPGGTAEPVEFAPDLFGEWIEDHPEVWPELMGAIMAAYRSHAEKREADRGN